MCGKVQVLIVAVGILAPLPVTDATAQQIIDPEAVKIYGRTDIPLVSEVRTYGRDPLAGPPDGQASSARSAVLYEPDRFDESSGGVRSYSQYLHYQFASGARHSGFPPVSAATSERQILLWCRGVSRIDYLYGSRAARLVIDRGTLSVSATARESSGAGGALNAKTPLKQTTLPADRLDRKIDPALWASFFDSRPAVYDMTIPVRHSECVIEAAQGKKYAFLWRADYHNDAAANVINGLWEVVNEALPAKPVTQFFPSPLFFPEHLRTPTGTYILSKSERMAWHDRWDALFTEQLIRLEETPLNGTKPEAPVFRLVGVTFAVFSENVFTMMFDRRNGARARYKSYERGKCAPKDKGLSMEYVVREFAAPAGLAQQLHGLLTSDAFKDAAGGAQRFPLRQSEGADYLFEFVRPDGTYIARERWSPNDEIFGEIVDLTYKAEQSPAAKAEAAVVFRRRTHDCQGRPTKQK